MKRIYKIVVITVMLISLSACAVGARGHLNFSETKYPISLSPALYDQDDNILVKDKQLQTVGKFKYKKRFWGIMYSWIRLSGDSDVDAAINHAIKENQGIGMINLAVTTKGCTSNAAMTFPISILPIIPGCADAEIEGDIVKLK